MDDMLLIDHQSGNAARLVVEFHHSEPIDLLEFSASLEALAREHQALVQKARPTLDASETRLLLIEVRKGSTVLELVQALAPIISSIEVTNSVLSFVEHLRRLGLPLSSERGRAPDATTQQLKNMSDCVQTIAADQKGAFVVSARHQTGEVLQEFRVESSGAREIVANAQSQIREIEAKSSSTMHKVLMRLHQSSISDPKVGKRASERGIIERIDAVPRALIYVSELAGQQIKDEIVKPGGNPYSKGFIVDVDVETVGGRPKAYRIMDVHDVIDLDDD